MNGKLILCIINAKIETYHETNYYSINDLCFSRCW